MRVLVQVDGAALSRCLFLIWQAWAKRTGGDEPGALDCLDNAILAVPPGVVEMILHLIELGELPCQLPTRLMSGSLAAGRHSPASSS